MNPEDFNVVPDEISSMSRLMKTFAAGVATVGAAALAVGPVMPLPSDVREDVQPVAVAAADVELTAADNPLTVLQAFFTETLVNSGYLQINGTNQAEALAEAFISEDVLGQIAGVISASAADPAATFAALAAYQTLSSTVWQAALFAPDDASTPNTVEGGVFTRLGPELQDFFDRVLPDMLTYDEPTQGTTVGYQPRQGDEVPGVYTQALFEFNYWFVEEFLRVIQPLTPVNDLASQLITSLPGGADTDLPLLLGAVSEGGFIRALIGPAQTTAFQFTAILDSVSEAAESGDFETVGGELVNLPVKLANAFVNGYTPVFSVCTNATVGCEPRAIEWPSQLDPGSQGGLVRYLLVDFPRTLTNILTDPDGPGTGNPLPGTAPVPVIPDEPNLPVGTLPPASPAPATLLADDVTPAARTASPAPEVLATDTEGTEEELLVVEDDDETETAPVRQYRPGRILSSIADRWSDRLGLNSDDDESDEGAVAADDDDADADADSDDDSDDSDNGSDDSGSEGGSED